MNRLVPVVSIFMVMSALYFMTSFSTFPVNKSQVFCIAPIKNIFKKDYYVEYDPYQNVNWENDFRCLSQHHDHLNLSESNLRAYDNAGYCAVPIFNYSGTKNIRGAWDKIYWPLSHYLDGYGTDEEFLKSTNNIKILFRAVEEAGEQHIISNFMDTYIESWEDKKDNPESENHYESTQSAIDLINLNNGLAFIAHPWTWKEKRVFKKLNDYKAVEIFTAFTYYKEEIANWDYGLNTDLLDFWDWVLMHKSTRIWGVAVNDHYGPNQKEAQKFPTIYDSGKTLALLDEYSHSSYQKAIEKGSFFAIKDIGSDKNNYPKIQDINMNKETISLKTNGQVNWIANGKVISKNRSISLSNLPACLKYLRAEVSNTNGTVYTQPFSLEYAK